MQATKISNVATVCGVPRSAYMQEWYAKNREAVLARAKKWHQNNKDSVRMADRRQRLKRYGLTLEQYESMNAQQFGLCYACGSHTDKPLVVDHNHSTEQVRKLLCSNCNVAIGYAKESPELLRSLARYIELHTPCANTILS